MNYTVLLTKYKNAPLFAMILSALFLISACGEEKASEIAVSPKPEYFDERVIKIVEEYSMTECGPKMKVRDKVTPAINKEVDDLKSDLYEYNEKIEERIKDFEITVQLSDEVLPYKCKDAPCQ